MPGQIRVIIVDWHKRRQADIVEAPARTDTLFIIDDAEGLLMLFQVVQEGPGRQRLFQIVLAPAFIDIVKIPGPAPRPRRDCKVALGLQKNKDVVALLPCFFQIGCGALADGKAEPVGHQPVQALQPPEEDALLFLLITSRNLQPLFHGAFKPLSQKITHFFLKNT